MNRKFKMGLEYFEAQAVYESGAFAYKSPSSASPGRQTK